MHDVRAVHDVAEAIRKLFMVSENVTIHRDMSNPLRTPSCGGSWYYMMLMTAHQRDVVANVVKRRSEISEIV